VDAAVVAANRGMRMDVSFYTWGPGVAYPDGSQAHGYITGSGLPMRFVDQTGAIVPVYQQVTSLIDEQLMVGPNSEALSTAAAIDVSKTLINDSQAGGYAAIATQWHVDYYTFAEVKLWIEATMDYAASLGVPLWTAERWLNYTTARAATTLTGLSWSAGAKQLSFTADVPVSSEPQSLALPGAFGGFGLTSVTVDGAAVTAVEQQITGRPVRFLSVGPGSHALVATYDTPIPPPESPPVAVNDTATVPEGQSVVIPVLANDGDPDGDPLTIASVTQGAIGAVTINADQTLTYTPNANACGADSFTYTISDGRGGTATASVSVSVTCLRVIHTTASDFGAACAVSTNTIFTRVGDGEVRLAGTQGDEYNQAALDLTRWVPGTWRDGTYAPAPAGGVLSIANANGAFVRSATALPVTTLEATVRFTGALSEHVGWGSLNFEGGYLLFSTFNTTTNLFARTNGGSGEQQTNLGPIPSGFHTYRIDRQATSPTTDQISYYIDGVLRARHTVATVPPMYVYQSHDGGSAPTLDIDRLWIYPSYVGAGTFQGCTMDSGSNASTWTLATWNAVVPAGTTLRLRTRTSLDGVAWSDWSAPLTTSGQAITNPAGRYLQYELQLTSTDPNQSPVVNAVDMRFTNSSIGNRAPLAAVDSASTLPGRAVVIPVLANDGDADGDAVTVVSATQGTNGAVVINADQTITYTPNANTCGVDTFTYTISDNRGGTASATVTVNVLCPSGQVIHTTVSDFGAACAMPTSTIVTRVGDGEVRLAGTQGDEYSQASLDPARWVAGTWSGGTYTPAPAGGVLSIANANGAFVRSATELPVTTLEATVQFTGAAWEHVGWGRLNLDSRYLLFSTFNTTTNLFARSNAGTGEQRTDLGPIPSGFHTYRIERASNQISYYIDGALRARHTVGTLPALYVYQSHNGGSAPTLDIDRLWVYPSYVGAGTFQSCTMDTGSNASSWVTATWSAVVPAGTTLQLRTRTSLDGVAWSDWSAPLTASGQAITSPAGRYLQYLVEPSSTDPTQSPVVDAVVMRFTDQPIGNRPPLAAADTVTTLEGRAVAISVLANDGDADGDPITVVSATQGAIGTVTINADQTVTYTPNPNVCGADSFTYTISDGRGGTASAPVSISVACLTVTQTTASDFGAACAVPTNTIVTRVGDGEVRLAGTQGDEYNQAALDPTRWVAGTWSGGAYTPAPTAGVLSIAHASGAFVRSANALPVTTLEATVQFTGALWEHVGWGSLDFGGGYLLFSTDNSTTNLFARTSNGRTEQRTDLGPIPSGFHTYRIDRQVTSPTSDQISYYIDGVLRAQHTVATVSPMYVYQSHNGGSAPTLDIDRLWVYPAYVGAGTFQSCTLDRGTVASTWTIATWNAVVPAGTTLQLRTRTSLDGVAWSDWSAPLTASGQAITSPNGRYLQYLLELTSSDPTQSPVVDSVVMRSAGNPTGNRPPLAAVDTASTLQGRPVTIAVLANDGDADGDAIAIVSATQGANGAVVVNPDQTITYTPNADVCGADSFTYTISDGFGGTATATVSVNVLCPSGQATHTTLGDFGAVCAVPTTTIVTRVGDGEVRLAGTQGDEYNQTALDPARWVAGTWSGGAYAPTLAGGVLSIANAAGAFVHSATTLPVTTLEATVQFTGAPWEHVGWGNLGLDNRYLLFSTDNTTTNLFARSNGGTGEQQTNLGPMPSGFHTYRIDRQASSPTSDLISYYIDGALRAQYTVATLPPLYVYQSHNGGSAPTLDIDRVWVYPNYVGAGTFQSCTMDAGATVSSWISATWNAVVPAGTTLQVRTRTSLDGVAWSDWSAPLTASGQAITSPAGRYLQYLVELTSTDPNQSPVVSDVTVRFRL
jgi:hypothetical protein